ncbi:PEGA domain-containing protein [Qipengyuania sphaerica]|uniref:PEGA domain-containing protein n=1 Tax=Qipengyuania sphaerica TaxID=2867243 RepID=UPI001C8678D3|nr:PEGA domain-containing protein [Qipengyuania sphaerica]MBX7541350.1 PEGA domain-containing protein [Qipengyuania sphaerica]
MNKLYTALAAAAAVGLSGCATVVNGPNLDYAVNTTPEGADITFLDGRTCTTPCELVMPRKDSSRVDIVREGYEPTYVLLWSKAGGATFGNILLGGGIGAAVDAGSGANRFLSPRPLIVRLAPVGSGEEAVLLDKKGEVIMTVAQHNAEAYEKVAKQIGDAAGEAPLEATAEATAEEVAVEEAAAEAATSE